MQFGIHMIWSEEIMVLIQGPESPYDPLEQLEVYQTRAHKCISGNSGQDQFRQVVEI